MPVVPQRLGKVDVERGLRRGQRTVVDVRGAVAEIVPEGEIDRVEGAVGHAVGAPGGADVPAPAAIGIATHPHEEALVPRLAVLHRLEAVPVREDVLHQVVLRLRRIGAVAIERHGLRHEHAVMRGTVEAHVRREVVSPVEERVVAVGVRNADLVLLPQFGKARPVVQARAVGGLLVGHLRGNPQPAIGAKRKADVALDPRPVAIARRILAVAGHHLAAFRALLQDDVDDAGKCVRAVLCRGTVTQHLDALDGAARDRADIHALGAMADLAERPHQRTRVPALAVHPNQHLVAVEAAHLEGRVKANVSDIDASGKFSDGTTWSSALPRSMAPDWVSTSAGITSIGTSDSACVRLLMRVPVTTTADRSVALAGFSPWDPTSWAGVAWSLSASCAFAMPASANSTDAANKVGMFRPRRSFMQSLPKH